MRGSLNREESTAEVLEGLRQARRLLRQPTGLAMAACLPRLEAAVQHLRRLENRLGDDAVPAGERPRLRRELADFERELRVIHALMNNAARFHSALGQLLTGGREALRYDAHGFFAAGATPPRLHLVRG